MTIILCRVVELVLSGLPFGKIYQRCPFVTREELLKLQKVDVARIIRVAVLNEVGEYFGCFAPSLETYFSWQQARRYFFQCAKFGVVSYSYYVYICLYSISLHVNIINFVDYYTIRFLQI